MAGASMGGGDVVELRGGHIELPPLRGLVGEGLSVQAWVRPTDVAGTQTLLDLAGGSGRIVLVLRGDRLALELIHGGRRLTVGAAAGVARAGAWVHVGASLDVAGAWAIEVAGRRAAGGQFAGLARAELAGLLGEALRVGGRVGGGVEGEPWVGALAEVRLWRRALTEAELTAGPAGRCRGDEPGLVACYRLDALDGDALEDVGEAQARARRVGAAQLVRADDLPLASARVYEVRARARLVRDHVPLAVFPADRALVPASEGAADRRAANAAAFGDVDGAFVLCSLHDAAIELTREGAAAGSVALQVRIDRDAWVLVEGVELSLERWTAGTTRAVTTAPTGRVRLRALAGEALAGPVLRVRGPDPEDMWMVVRPGDAAQAKMHRLTAEELLAPADGRPSPLGADSDEADAEAIAELVTALASALPIEAPVDDEADPSFVSFGIGGSIEKGFKKAKKGAGDAGKKAADGGKKAVDDGKKAADDAAKKAAEAKKKAEEAAKSADAAARKAAEEAAREAEAAAAAARRASDEEWQRVKHRASALVVDGLAEATALIERARELPAEVGPAAIRRRIAEARALTVATGMTGALRGTVELVGTAIVDGIEQPWRIVVAGVVDVVAAIEALAVRVGAVLRRLVDLLADLFPWQRYLEVSDRLYAASRRALNDLQARQGEFTGLVETLRDLVARPIDARLADRTLGEVLGVRARKSRVLDDLERILDHAQRLLSSREVAVDGGDPAPAPEGAVIAAEAATAPAAAAAASVPRDIFEDPRALFDRPMRPLLAFPGEVYRACAPVLEPSLRAIEGAIPATLRAAERTIAGRLKVPVLTGMIEVTILGGRSLDLLRIVCLLGAILKVSLESADEMISFGAGERDARDLEWVGAGFGFLNSVVVLLRVADEHVTGARWAGVLFGVNAALTAMQSAIGFAYAGVVGGPALPFMIVQSTLDLALAGWYGCMSAVYLSAEGPAGVQVAKAMTATPDLIVELSLGAASILTTGVAYGVKTMNDDEFGAAIGFRFSSWTLRGLQRVCDGLDNNPAYGKFAAPCSAVFAGMVCAVEFTACAYAIGELGADEA